MTYNPSVPAINTRIDNTYNIVQNNFDQANTIFGVDHFPFNYATSGDRGVHKQCTFRGNTAIPAPAAGSGAVYGQTQTLVALDNRVYPFWKRDGLATVYPMAPIKAWATFIPTSTPGLCTITSNFNVTSVTRTATTGIYAVVLAESLPFSAGTVEYNVFLNGSPGGSTPVPFSISILPLWFATGYVPLAIPVPTANTFYISCLDTLSRCSLVVVQ